MAREKAESSTSAKRRDGERGAMLDSLVVGAPLRTTEKDPPRYGAQHRQDALWEGGNEALPFRWQQFQALDGAMVYQDDTLMMASRTRPLPGVQLDDHGRLVLGCEWHISPLGRSYFVNHNTRTTSWTKPTPERPRGSLQPEWIIEGHSKLIRNLRYMGTGCNIMSASNDGSIRQWTRDGESVGRTWDSDGRAVCSMEMSPDETMVVSGSADGRIRLWNIQEERVVGDPWEGHDDPVRCLDWSPNAPEIVSGSDDGTIRRWNSNTGQQIAPPIKTSHGWVFAVKYSPRGDKFTSGGVDMMICVWSNDGELLVEIKGHDYEVASLCWSKDGTYIFSASGDHTIRKWRSIDGQELFVFRGHAQGVNSLCLSPDESYLVSASMDCSVRIWDLETNESVGNPLLHDDELRALAISPDRKYIASAGMDAKIYVWSMKAALKRHGDDHHPDNAKLKGRAARPRHVSDASLVPKQLPNNRGLAKYGKDFWNSDTNPASPRAAPTDSPASAHRWRNLLGSLRFSTRPADAPQTIPLEPRHWNFSLFSAGSSIRTVNVAPGRKKNRIFISPPTAAELAAAELAAGIQHRGINEAGGSRQMGQPTPWTRGSQARPTETQGSSGGTGEVSYEVTCCGFFFGRRRPTSHQS